jgi:benzoylsuccinyl-CoA thiolase BbsB subunit
MRKVAVIGAAMGRIGRYPELMFQDLGWPAVKGAIEDAGLARNQIEAVYCGSAYGGRLAGQRVLRPLGMTGIPVINCENACSSGATAFREAFLAIAEGRHDRVLVIGIDKLTMLGGGVLPGQPEARRVSSITSISLMPKPRWLAPRRWARSQIRLWLERASPGGAISLRPIWIWLWPPAW